MKALMFLLLFVPTLVKAVGPLTEREIQMQIAMTALYLVDYGQTRDIKNHVGYYETNPLLGKHPSDVRIRNYFAGVIVGSAVVTYLLPSNLRPYWQWGNIIVQVGVTAHNHNIGLGVKF